MNKNYGVRHLQVPHLAPGGNTLSYLRPRLRPCLVSGLVKISQNNELLHEILNVVYLQNLFSDGCNFS